MTDIEVMMKCGCTRSEAEKHLKAGSIVINLDEPYMRDVLAGNIEDVDPFYDYVAQYIDDCRKGNAYKHDMDYYKAENGSEYIVVYVL